jgi:MoaA/NifB/PqqE/SkfB family radical SAM enzyme
MTDEPTQGRLANSPAVLKRPDGEALLTTSKIVCMAPWVHVHLSSLGDFTPCCEIFEPLGSSEGATLVSHWNGTGMRSFRVAMLGDAPLRVCRKCYDKEAAGLASRRQQFNAFYRDDADRLNATGSDGALPDSLPPIDLDLRFSNLCNFRCRSCWHGASSRWFSDATSLGLAKGPSAVIVGGADRAKIFAQAMERLSVLRSIYFAGGEPLLMEEHYALLEGLIRAGRTDVRLSYNTNLSELGLGERKVTDLWQAFEHVRVGASADGMGAAGELIRKGIAWDRFEGNLRSVRAACPHVRLSLAITVSALNLFHIPEFYAHAHGALGFDHHAINLSPLQEPRHYNIQILPRAMKRSAAAALTALAQALPENRPSSESAEPGTRVGKSAVLDLIRYMGARDDHQYVPNFVAITERLDALRGEDTFSTIPELAPLRAIAHRMRTPWRRAIRAVGLLTGRRSHGLG